MSLIHRASRPVLIKIALLNYGITTIISQVILIRELMVVFYGNELSSGILLAVWLFWTALGSGFIGKIVPPTLNSLVFFVGVHIGISLLLPLTMYANRMSLLVINHTPGEITGIIPIMAIPTITLSLFCFLAGALFTLGCRLYSTVETKKSAIVGRVYLLEAIGAASGGVLASFLLIKYFTNFQIAAFIGVFNLTIGTWLILNHRFHRHWWRLLVVGLIALGSFWALIKAVRWFEKDAQQNFWRDYQIAGTRNSIYGTITVTELERTYSFFQNGLLMYTVPDLYYAEESIHFALLQHPNPQSILLIGGGTSGSLTEILKYPSIKRVDYVELDPTLIRMAQTHLPAAETKVLNDPRVHLHFRDGRLFVKSTSHQYDVILANIPNPASTQLNRFYTVEFFQEVRNRLRQSGIYAFSVVSAENYISEPLAQFLGCLFRSLQRCFEEVVIIPGNSNYFLSTVTAGTLTSDPQVLINRLQQRTIVNEFVNEYYLPFRMTPERMSYLRSQIEQASPVRLNRDFKPIAYFFDLILWSSHTNPFFRDVFSYIAQHKLQSSLILLGLLVILISGGFTGIALRQPTRQSAIVISVMIVGFSEISLEVGLIIAFQALYGFAYYQVALIVTGFMFGLTMGSWFAARHIQLIKTNLLNYFLRIQFIIGLLPFVLIMMLALLTYLPVEALSQLLVIEVIFMILIFSTGLAGGYHFVVASALITQMGRTSPEKSGGTLYAYDLVGSCGGALLTSSFLIPLFGIYQSFILYGLLNLIILVMIILTYRINLKKSFSRQSTQPHE